MFEKILAATDGSEHGLRAAKVAVELGKISGGKVFAVYVADTQRTAHLPDDMLLFSIKELLLKEGKEAIKQVQELAEKNGIEVIETDLGLFDLYTGDEVFVTGTAAEVAPVTKIDGRIIGSGKPGQITKELMVAFRELATSSGTPI